MTTSTPNLDAALDNLRPWRELSILEIAAATRELATLRADAAKVEQMREVLIAARLAAFTAIYHEDGLDGAAGDDLIKQINEVLGDVDMPLYAPIVGSAENALWGKPYRGDVNEGDNPYPDAHFTPGFDL